MRLARRVFLALVAASAFAACDLNPQPLPPGSEPSDRASEGDDGGGSFTTPQQNADAGDDKGGGTADASPPAPGDGGDGGSGDGDGGDGGDASDASDSG
jgi:hypothetical protein